MYSIIYFNYQEQKKYVQVIKGLKIYNIFSLLISHLLKSFKTKTNYQPQ